MSDTRSLSHSTAGIQVILGGQFTLTDDEMVLLMGHMRKALYQLDQGPVGWRVQFVREITFINRIIRGALDRAHTYPPTRAGDSDIVRGLEEGLIK